MARLRTRVIPEEFWERKMTEWTREERSILDALARLERPTNKRLLTAQRILELANKAYSLYLARNPEDQAQLLRMVLLNCAIDGASVQPTYRKPFDLIFARAKSQNWSGREDLNLRPPGPETRGANWMARLSAPGSLAVHSRRITYFVLQVFSKMRLFDRSCRSQRNVKSLALRNLAEREGFEPSVQVLARTTV
jgi:hypothetical protein